MTFNKTWNKSGFLGVAWEQPDRYNAWYYVLIVGFGPWEWEKRWKKILPDRNSR